MNPNEARNAIANHNYSKVVLFIANCIKAKIPTSSYRDLGDWIQEIYLMILLNKEKILSADNVLNFLFVMVYNKIKNEYRRKENENSALSVFANMLIESPSLNLKKETVETIMSAAIKELKALNPKNEKVNKLMIDYITKGENHTKERILEMISPRAFYTNKNIVDNTLRKQVCNLEITL